MVLLSDEEIEKTWRCHDAITVRDAERNIAKAQLKAVYDWGNEDCNEHGFKIVEGNLIGKYRRRDCPICWQELPMEASDD